MSYISLKLLFLLQVDSCLIKIVCQLKVKVKLFQTLFELGKQFSFSPIFTKSDTRADLSTLLGRALMKLAGIQCKSQINRNLSSQVTLDGHCFHGKVLSWCPSTFEKVSQPCACVHACTQAPRGF